MTGTTVLWAVVGDLGRTGVPLALERMVRWLTVDGPADVACHVVAGRDGPLGDPLAAVAASVTTLEPAQGRSPMASLAVAGAVVGQPGPGRRARDRWYRHRTRHLPRPDVVLVHGAGAWELASALEPRWSGARLVVHLHELEVALGRSGLAAHDPSLVARPDSVLAVAPAVADLAVRRGADPARVGLVPGAVDAPPRGWESAPEAGAGDVLSIGECGWRKGTDRAEAAAWELRRLRPDLRWHWVGRPPASPWGWAVGTPTALVHHGERPDPWSVVAAPAGLVVPSREDPMPLVVLEAAARAVPVVASATGGLVDLLGSGRGTVVGATGLGELVAAVADLVAAPEEAAERALALRDHVRLHHATDVVGPRWLEAVLGGA